MLDLGTKRPGSTIRIPLDTFGATNGESVTATGLVVGDIVVYKDGSTTERASTAGFTATTDFDGKTGLHVLVIDLADNTTAGFFAAGSEYLVGVADITVDSQTVRTWVARFEIGYPDAILNTTIATLASQTSFTLTSGPADDDALNGMPCIIHDAASGVQIAKGIISDYTGSTKTVTLDGDPGVFTMAAGDNISVFIGAALNPTARGNLETAADNYSATRGLAGTALPAAAAGGSGGVPTVDANNRVAGVQGTLNTLDDLDAAQDSQHSTTQGLVTTVDTVADGIKAVTDNLPDSGALTSIATNVSTLVTKLTTGITSLAEWLGAAFGKQAPDATAQTEIRATGAGSGTFDPTTDSLEAIRDTAPLGTAMRGTDSAALASVCTEARLAELDAGNLPADVAANASALTTIDGIVDQILADTGTDGVALASATLNAIADALLDRADGVEPGSAGTERTVREALRLMLSALAGKSTNGGKTFRDTNDTMDRITATVDGSNNRTAVTLDDT